MITQKDPNVCIIVLKRKFRWGSIFPWEDMEVKLHFETKKRNRIVKFYCAFDAVQCWCALFPAPPPRRQWHNIPQSLPPTPAWPWTCPDSTRKYKSPLSSINWGNIVGEWTEISSLKEQIDKSFAMIANAGPCYNLLGISPICDWKCEVGSIKINLLWFFLSL